MPAPNGELTVPYEKYPLMRIVLHQLRLHYPTLNGPARLDIFNAILHDQLEEEGFEDGKLTSSDKPAGDIGLSKKYSGVGSSGDTMRLYKTDAGEEDLGDDVAPGPSRKRVAKKAKKGKKASGKKGNRSPPIDGYDSFASLRFVLIAS